MKTPANSKEIREAFGRAFSGGITREAFEKRLNEIVGKELTPVAIAQIIGGLIQVSPVRARQIQKASRGKVQASLLRPDIYGR